MAPVHTRLKRALAVVVLSTSAVSAQQPVRRAVTPRPATAPGEAAQRAAQDTRSLFTGIVLDEQRAPKPKVTVRLRNLDVNAVEGTDLTNELGEFTFLVRPNVPYIVEVLDQADRAVVVSDVLTVDVGGVTRSILTLPTGLPPTNGIFGETAGMILSAVAGTGLTILDPALPKVSPKQ